MVPGGLGNKYLFEEMLFMRQMDKTSRKEKGCCHFPGAFLKFFKIYLFIERERMSRVRGEREQRERILSKFCTVMAEPGMGLKLTNYEIMT